MSPIAKALRRQTPAEHLDARIFTNPFPDVVDEFAMLMLRIGVKLECGVKPAALKGRAA